MTPSSEKQRGAVLLMVVVCLFVVSLLSFALMKSTVTHHRQSMRCQHELQAMWLAESAIARAHDQLIKSNDYTGETWEISPDELDGRHSAVVTIRVETLENDEQSRKVVVTASYPDVETKRVRHTKSITVDFARVESTTGDAP